MEIITSLLLSIPGLILALSMHEFAHGYAAYKMGDNTAKYQGRLSLNPLHHLDPIGTLCLFLFKFGWAKPVPINPYNFKNRRAGIIVVSLAGPIMNFFVALTCKVFIEIIWKLYWFNDFSLFLLQILEYSIGLNIGLMCFNLIPLPPLDGSKILSELLPYRYREAFYTLERYSSYILMIALITNALDPILNRMYYYVGTLIYNIVGLVF